MSFGPSRGRAGFFWEVSCVCVRVWGGGLQRKRDREKWTDIMLSAASAQNEERQRTAKKDSEQGRTYVVVPGHVKGGDAGGEDERERERGGEGTRSEAEHGWAADAQRRVSDE